MSRFQTSNGFMPNVPVITKNLIIINALAWLLTVVLKRSGLDVQHFLGMHYVGSDAFFPTQLITYMFMHDLSGVWHVFFNMFAVFMFGRILEQVWGPKRFLLFYLVTGVGAGIIQQIT